MRCCAFLRNNKVSNYFLEIDGAAINILFLSVVVEAVGAPLVYHIALREEPEVYDIIERFERIFVSLRARRNTL